MADHALVIGSETFSRILDWEDRGDLRAVRRRRRRGRARRREDGRGPRASSPPGSTPTGATTTCSIVDGGASTTGTVGKLRMKGREVFRHAVVNLADGAQRGARPPPAIDADEVDWVVPHQANKRILDATAQEARPATRQGGRHRRPARQYLGRVGAAGARRRGARRADQAGRPGRARSDGRRLHLGRGGRPLSDHGNSSNVDCRQWPIALNRKLD